MTQAQNLRLKLMARLLGTEWDIRWNNDLGYYQADLRGVSVREGSGCLLSTWGKGPTAEDAVNGYLVSLSGRTIVMEPASPRRREVFMPDNLTAAVFGD